jgi:thiol-disulfide isomerase/thioredoxin
MFIASYCIMKKMSSNIAGFWKRLWRASVFTLIAIVSCHLSWAQRANTDTCAQFILNITKEGESSDSVRLLYHDCSELSGDTILELKNPVTYRGTVKRATEIVMFTNIYNRILDGPHIIRFILEPGQINLSFSLKNDTVRDLKITGPKSYLEKENWETVHDPHYDDMLLTNYRKAKNNPTLRKLYLEKIDSLYEKRTAAVVEYIKAHPDSYFSGYLLSHYIRRIPLDSMQVYYTAFTDRIKQSQIGRDILSELFARSGDMNFRKQNSDPVFFSQLEKIKSFHDLSLPDITGQVHQLSKLKGRYVVVDFWSSGCGPCFKNIPHLKKLVDEMKDKQVEFVSISIDKDVESCKKAMATHHFPGLSLVDTSGLTASYYKVPWVPKYVIIRPDGTLAYDDAPHPISGELKPLLLSIINKKE